MKDIGKEKEKLLKEIEEDRTRLVKLEEENLSKSFGKFFAKPLFASFGVGLVLEYIKLDDRKVMVGFLLSFFIFLLIFSIKTKKDFEKRSELIEKEKIKIQSRIFSNSRKLAELSKEKSDKEQEDLKS